MTRTFIALEMNPVQQSQLADVTRKLAHTFPAIRWVNASSIHLTLAFLGELSDEQRIQAQQATSRAARLTSEFSYRLSGVGIFGSIARPRVIWMGIEEPSGRLRNLHRILNRELEQLGFAVDTRPFSPHLTLARPKGALTQADQQRLQQVLQSSQYAVQESYIVQHITVMKSELLRTGAQYTQLQSYLLRSPSF